MNYYRRFIADYLAKTQSLSMIEDGAYNRLLDYCYSNECCLPADMKAVYRIARANSAAEKRAVDAVLRAHFESKSDGHHNSRVDQELEAALEKITKQREVGKVNGIKGGRPKKAPASETKQETNLGIFQKPNLDMENNQLYNQPPSSNHQPKPKTETTPAVVTRTTPPEIPAAGVVPREPDPKLVATVEAMRVAAGVGTDEHGKAGELFHALVANSVKCSPAHPIIVEWVRHGVTVAEVRGAIAEARKSNDGQLNPKYLAAIIDRLRSEGPKNGKAQAWATDDKACEIKARELGLWPAKAGESYDGLRNRIRAKLTQQADASVR